VRGDEPRRRACRPASTPRGGARCRGARTPARPARARGRATPAWGGRRRRRRRRLPPGTCGAPAGAAAGPGFPGFRGSAAVLRRVRRDVRHGDRMPAEGVDGGVEAAIRTPPTGGWRYRCRGPRGAGRRRRGWDGPSRTGTERRGLRVAPGCERTGRVARSSPTGPGTGLSGWSRARSSRPFRPPHRSSVAQCKALVCLVRHSSDIGPTVTPNGRRKPVLLPVLAGSVRRHHSARGSAVCVFGRCRLDPPGDQ
jgi:hypothetical protein